MTYGDGRDQGLPGVAVLVAMQGVVAAASLVVEIVAGRMLAPYVGMSLYTWTSVIAVVLAGFSAGHWAGGRMAEAPPRRALLLTGWSMAGAALSTAAAVFVLRLAAGPVIAAMQSPVGAIVALSMLVFFLPSFFAGIPAPVLAQIAVLARPGQTGRALGAMFAAGAVGAIGGTLLAGFLFISWLGSAGTLAAVTAAYAGLAALCFALAGRIAPVGRWAVLGLAVLLPLGVAGAGLARPDPCTEESDYFCIRVIEEPGAPGVGPTRLMVLDHLVHGISSRDNPSEMLTYHAAALDALARARMAGRDRFGAFFIGGGTYSIPRSWAATRPGAEVTVAEIDPVVTRVAAREFWFDPASARVLNDDARRALLTRPDSYDVIIGDAFTDIAVPPHLITREFFELVESRLTGEGIYLMNVIDHMDRLQALTAIARTLGEVFPVVEIWANPDAIGVENRQVFILLAGRSASPFSALRTLSPEGYRVVRFARDARDQLLAETASPVLTDNYAPIDRLLGHGDWAER
ncbi:fused MFS/spermidine synthase [Actibacterium sp. MT2.3-13A]|uniref:fused MFS/spermidine synthase n=1 Tax=Actibacterium sp. MT2.3-13A TaxID=2828332 RepID=UPI001BA5B583|nr:fused MFS/spermidine synthase [Actibacterium sp. MT2.3-13A]